LFGLLREKKGGFRIEGGLAEGEVWLQDLLAKYKGAARPKLEIGPDDTALFQYSGGTTGVSKAAVAMHRTSRLKVAGTPR
jgi:long-chain acyl-CoA synthetase